VHPTNIADVKRNRFSVGSHPARKSREERKKASTTVVTLRAAVLKHNGRHLHNISYVGFLASWISSN